MDRHYYIEYLGNSVELPLGETVVGRDVGCRLRFNDPAVSRRHLRFVRRADEVFVEDLRSSNGTRLNGLPVSIPALLHDGDAIMVGGRTLVVRIADGTFSASQTLNLMELPSDARSLGAISRTRTAPHSAVTTPPANQQRCPRCGSLVGATDDECKTCRFEWGGFRVASRTNVNQRAHERHVVELQLVYVSADLEIEAMSRDLSPSGLFVCSQVLEPIGTRCTLTFLVDGGPSFKLQGVVRRVVEHDETSGLAGLGIEFVDVGEVERTWIAAVIKRLSA